MPWAVAAAAVAAGGAIYSANKESSAAKDAANASQNATNASLAEQKREFDINQANQQPYLQTGTSALNALAGIEGLNGSAPDYSSFYASPDYQFALQQGQGALDRDAAARGTLYSGGHTTDAIKFGQGLASQQFGNYYNRLAGLAGVGQSAANQLGAYGQNYANAVGTLNTNNTANTANAGYQQANAYTNLAGQISGIGGQLAGYYMNQPQYSMPQVQPDYTQTLAAPQFTISNPQVGKAPMLAGGLL